MSTSSNGPEGMLIGGYTTVDLSFMLARAYELSGDKDSADQAYAECFKLMPSSQSHVNAKAWLRDGKTWRERAQYYEKKGHHAVASDAWMQAVRLRKRGSPITKDIWMTLAHCFRRCGELKNAIQCAEKAHSVFPWSPEIRHFLSHCASKIWAKPIAREAAASLLIQRTIARGCKGRREGQAYMKNERFQRNLRYNSATKIQSCWRGYIWRKVARKYKERCERLIRKSLLRISTRVLGDNLKYWVFWTRQRKRFKLLVLKRNAACLEWVFAMWVKWWRLRLKDEQRRLEYEQKVKMSLWRIAQARKAKSVALWRRYAVLMRRVKRTARRAFLRQKEYVYLSLSLSLSLSL